MAFEQHCSVSTFSKYPLACLFVCFHFSCSLCFHPSLNDLNFHSVSRDVYSVDFPHSGYI